MKEFDKLSRREFIVGAGGFATGAAVGSVLGGGLFNLLPAQAAENTPSWPGGYAQLDPRAAYKLGYDTYNSGGG